MTLKAFTYRIQPALILDLGDGVVMPFQYISEGSFWMGSRGYNPDEEPRHFVTLTQPFYLGTFPVTQEQFARWKPEHKNHFPNRPDHPAEQISWRHAVDYCGWLKKNCADQIPADFDVGLPTEAQWEYACRAGTDTEYHSGDGEAALFQAGWFEENSLSQTHPVGFFAENDFGLYDTHGNVFEWCTDSWDKNAFSKRLNHALDPFVIENGSNDRVVRGGCWIFHREACKASFRFGFNQDQHHYTSLIGFRIQLSPAKLILS